jgi:hypothetical protein
MFRQLQANGVTSIIDMSDDLQNFFGTVGGGAGLTGIEPPYEPEIVVNSDSDVGSLQNANDNYQSIYSPAAPYLDGVFGITFGWVVPQYPGEFWSQAVREVDPSSTYDPGPDYYLALMQLFTAIQRAGAHLSASAVESGLGNFTRGFTQPYGLTGAYNGALSGFVQDQEMHYWDSSQTPADTSEPGCFVDVANGARYPGDTWPSGDHAHDPGKCNAIFDPTYGGSGAASSGYQP